MRHSFLAALVLLAGSACSKPAPQEEPRSALENTVRGIGSTPPCSSLIESNQSPNWPVPAIEKGQRIYRVFFSGWGGLAKNPPAYRNAESWATFTPDGKILDCRSGARAEVIAEDPPLGLSLDEIVRRQSQLYAATEKIAELFWSDRPLNPDEKGQVAEYSMRFKQLALSGHAKAYRALNPAFWAWVEQNGGKAP